MKYAGGDGGWAMSDGGWSGRGWGAEAGWPWRVGVSGVWLYLAYLLQPSAIRLQKSSTSRASVWGHLH